MAGKTFTVTASGWSGSCQSANLDFNQTCSACSLTESATKSISGTSVSWTTLTATPSTSQKIKVSVSGTCTPDSGEVSFDVKTAPSLSATVSPTSTSVTQGSTFTLSINIQNSGETTTQFGTIAVSPSDFSISDCSPSPIAGGQSLGMNCRIAASSSATTGSRTVTLTIAPSNADSLTRTVTVSVGAAPVTPSAAGEETVGGGAEAKTKVTTQRGKATITIPFIAASKMANVSITKTEDMAVNRIEITVKNSVKNIQVVVTKLAQKPATVVQEVVGKVYHYIEVSKTNITDADVSKVKINFKVEKSWITANGINESTIALNRYADNKWNKLTTSKVSEDISDIYFEAESPGLSVFVITCEEKVAVLACPTCQSPSAWSDCVNGKQTRTNYKCDSSTNYQCQSYTETKDCAITLPKEIPTWVYAVVIIVVIAVVLIVMKFRGIKLPLIGG
ncbi:MAG: PGF-pre-PGF domain-containing protein [Thaumarchaeota archaeon]|nr:PGF-pre-PGF domain-containing protein [Nitrososphaerota archaeon]